MELKQKFEFKIKKLIKSSKLNIDFYIKKWNVFSFLYLWKREQFTIAKQIQILYNSKYNK